MRHIKKYNESSEDGLDVEYIKSCFIEFFDNGVAQDYPDESNFLAIEIITPEKPKDWGFFDKILEDYIEYSDLMKDFYKDIQTGKQKLMIKYPKIKIEIIHNMTYSIELRIYQ